MATETHNRPALAVILPGDGGDLAPFVLQRYSDVVIFPSLDDWSPEATPTLDDAFRTAADQGLRWISVPARYAPAQDVLREAVNAAATYTHGQNPGFILHLVRDRPVDVAGEAPAYRRILVVIDADDAQVSGLSALAAIALASRAGASVDVLLVNTSFARDSNDAARIAQVAALGTWRARSDYATARSLAELYNIEITWSATGPVADKLAAVQEHMAQGGHDIVVNDIGDVRLSRGLGRKSSLARVFSADSDGDLAARLLAAGVSDVIVALDAIRVSTDSRRVALGATAAMTLGVFLPSIGSMSASASTVSHSSATSIGAPAAGGVDVVGDDTVTPEAVADEVKESTEKAVDQEQEQALPKVKGKVAKNATESTVKEMKADIKDAKEDLEKAEKHLAKVEDQLAVATKGLEKTAEDMTDLTAEYSEVAETAAQAEEAATQAEGGIFHFGAEKASTAAASATMDLAGADLALQTVSDDAVALTMQQSVAELELDDARADAKAAQKSLAQAKADYEVTAEWVEDNPRTFTKPADGHVTSPFGMRVHPVTGVYKLHTGVDFSAAEGTKIYAGADGTVTYAGYDTAYGNLVKIDHGTVNGHKVETWYAHQTDLRVDVGEKVERGETIGKIGSTGYSTGAHLHFEVRIDGDPVDPMLYID